MKIKDLTLCAIFAAIMAVSSWIYIPGIVPFTMQTFCVYLAVFVLGGKRASVSMGVYLFLGAAGLPVFSGFQGGAAVLLGPSGGYLIGFIVICLVYWMLEKTGTNGVASAAAGTFFCYAIGTIWYMSVYLKWEGTALGAVLLQCVVPYVVPDAVKMIIARLAANRIKSSTGQ